MHCEHSSRTPSSTPTWLISNFAVAKYSGTSTCTWSPHVNIMSSANAVWSNLPLELWVSVLSRLKADLDPSFVWPRRSYLERFAQEHSKLHTMRLVCSNFNAALDDSQFSRCLFLREAFSTRNLPNLLRWAKRQHTSLQLFACAVGAPTLEAVLAAVASSESPLQFAQVCKVSQAAVDILPCYSALHTIELGSGGDSRPLLCLQSLAALPTLGKLILVEGTFQGVETLLHLTNLWLADASVTCPAGCVWASRLLKLRVHHSELYLQGRGLVACQNLRRLMLWNCVVDASQHNDTLALTDNAAAHIPAGIATLTQLTFLMITLDVHALDDITFSWLGSLTALQDLAFNTHKDMELPAELTDLTSLTYLGLTTGDSEEEEARVCIDVQVDWPRMRSLKNLSIYSGVYTFDSQLLQILNCTAIKELHFDKVSPAGADSAMYFAAVMPLKRPDVACYWDFDHMSDVLDKGRTPPSP